MSKFPDELLISEAGYVHDCLLVRVERDFSYISSYGKVTVKKGTISDGASIPKMFHSILGPFGRWFKSALIHDVLYKKDCGYDFDRKTCDLIFLEGMVDLQVPFIKRQTIYRAVRLFGWTAFRKK